MTDENDTFNWCMTHVPTKSQLAEMGRRNDADGMKKPKHHPNIIDKVAFNGIVGGIVWGCYLASGALWLCRMIWLGVLVVWVGAGKAFRFLTSDSNWALLFWMALACAVLGFLIGGR